MTDQVRFCIIGATGWRAEFFLRIARELPDRFVVTSALVRDSAKAEIFERKWPGVPVSRALDELLATNPEFVVVSVPWDISPILLRELHDRNMPALAETPPAPDIDAMNALFHAVGKNNRIQVAEQYHLQPLHAARTAVIKSGKLGDVWHAHVSVAHGYHGVSLIRRFLGVDFENAKITARSFTSPIVGSHGRGGPPAEEAIASSNQAIAQLAFDNGKTAVFDFTGDQYFSWIRSQTVVIRGERGEINNEDVRWLKDFRTPLRERLNRIDTGHAGNLEGYHHKGYTLGGEWVYENPLAPGRLSDDEIAVGICLLKMHEFVDGGAPFYSLAEACQDHYLGILIDQAAKAEGEVVRSDGQGWTNSL